MANKALSVKFDSQGYDELLAQLQQIPKSFGGALDAARKTAEEIIKESQKLTAGTKEYEQAQKSLAQVARQETNAIAGAYRELRVKSTSDIEAQKTAAISAFEAIKKSGTASAQDVKNANAALINQLKVLDDQLDTTKKKAVETSEGFTVLRGTISNLASQAIIGAVQSLTSSLQSLGSNVISVGTTAERAQVAFETFLGSASKAKEVMKQVRDFAATTPFELPEVTNAAKTLLASKTPADQLIPTIKRLGEIAAGSDKPLSQLLFVYNQIKNQGRALGQDINQLLNAGLSMEDIAKALGKSAKELGEMKGSSKGLQLSFEEVDKVLKSVTSKGGRFYELMDKLGNTTAVKLSNVNDAFTKIYQSIYNGISPALSGVLDLIVETLNPLGDNVDLWKGINKQSIEFQTYLKANPGIAKELNKTLTEGVEVALQGITDLAKELLGYLQQNPHAIADAVKQLGALLNLAKSFLWVTSKTVEGWIKIGDYITQAKSAMTGQGGGVEQVNREMIFKAYGSSGVNIFDQKVKALDDPKLGGNFINLVPGAKDKAIEQLAFEMLGNPDKYPGLMEDITQSGGSKLKGVLGYVGATGDATGPHVHLGIKKPSGGYANEQRVLEVAKLIQVGGSRLSDYPITSHMGMRNLNRGLRMHAGVDFSGPNINNQPITFAGSGVVSTKIKRNTGDGGNVYEITLATGEVAKIMHLSSFGDAVIDAATKAVKTATKTAVGNDHKEGEANLKQYLNRIALGESSLGKNLGPNSLGARGWYGFMPPSRQYVLSKTGLDAWSNDPKQHESAALYWIKTQFPTAYKAIIAGDYAKADKILGKSQFTSLPGGSEHSRAWNNPDNINKYGPVEGRTQSGTGLEYVEKLQGISKKEEFNSVNFFGKMVDTWVRDYKAGVKANSQNVKDFGKVVFGDAKFSPFRPIPIDNYGNNSDFYSLLRGRMAKGFNPKEGFLNTRLSAQTRYGDKLSKFIFTPSNLDFSKETILGSLDYLMKQDFSNLYTPDFGSGLSAKGSTEPFIATPENISPILGDIKFPRYAGSYKGIEGAIGTGPSERLLEITKELNKIEQESEYYTLKKNDAAVKSNEIRKIQLELEKELIAIAQDNLLTEEESNQKSELSKAIAQEKIDALTETKNAFDDLGKSVTDLSENSLATFFETTLDGTKSISNAFSDMVKSILQGISQIAAKLATSELFKLLGLTAQESSVSPLAGTLGSLFSSGSDLSLGDSGTFSGNAVPNTGILGSLATGALGLLGGSLGFASGGYTGSGNPNQVAGLVHRGEFVFPSHSVNAIGVGLLSNLASGKRMPMLNSSQIAPSSINYRTLNYNVLPSESRFYQQERTVARKTFEELGLS